LSISTGYKDDSGTVDSEIEKLCAHPTQTEDRNGNISTPDTRTPMEQVPPPQAPTQTTYVQAVPRSKRCAAWPWCNKTDYGDTKFNCRTHGVSLRADPKLATMLKKQRDVKLRKERREQKQKKIT